MRVENRMLELKANCGTKSILEKEIDEIFDGVSLDAKVTNKEWRDNWEVAENLLSKVGLHY